MSNIKFTPGPWKDSGNGNSFIRGVDGQPVASVYGDDPECHPDERMAANCALIAAAPELLETLQAMVNRIEHYTRIGEHSQRLNIEQWEYTEGSTDMANARAALAKATGEQS